MEQVTVTIMPCAEDQEKATDSKEAKGNFHIFHGHDMLLGDGEDLPAIELKPTQILECNGPDDSALSRLNTSLRAPSKTADESEKLREYSMQEYTALKTLESQQRRITAAEFSLEPGVLLERTPLVFNRLYDIWDLVLRNVVIPQVSR